MVAFPAWTVEEGMSVTLSCRAGFEGEQEVLDCQSDGAFSAEPQISCQKKGRHEHPRLFCRGNKSCDIKYLSLNFLSF